MITVLGLGFVGLTTALGFADKGFTVYGIEANADKARALSEGNVPFHEPGLPEKLKEHSGKNFVLTDDLARAISDSQIIMLCVGTPSGDDGKVDLGQIKSALKEIVSVKAKGDFKTVCIKSTVPPSSTSKDAREYLESLGVVVDEELGLANNPEFLREGYAWQDFIDPDRVVIGVENDKSRVVLEEVYKPFGVDIHVVSLNTGEYIKYLSNTLLSSLISFANEMSMIASSIGDIDIKRAFEIVHEDKRWFGQPANMASYAYPGCGFGGYCLPKDTSALIGKAQDFGYDAGGLREVLRINNQICQFLVSRMGASVAKDRKVAILGLAFKPNSDDVRMTPSAVVIEEIKKQGFADVVAYDPLATNEFKFLYNFDIDYAQSLDEAIDGAEAIVIATAWDEFKENQFKFEGKQVFDFRYSL